MNYKIKDYVVDMDVKIVSPEEAKKERYVDVGVSKAEFKSAVIRYYYLSNFFDGATMSLNDMVLLENGISPRMEKENGNTESVYTLHHILPVSCGGKTVANNLVPLPRDFHTFIHRYILDPQIKNLNVGDEKVVRGTPNFNKLNMGMIQDQLFKLAYLKFLVDEYKLYPSHVKRICRSRFDKKEWYNRKFKELIR